MILTEPTYIFFDRPNFEFATSFIQASNLVKTIEKSSIVLIPIWTIIQVSNEDINNILDSGKKIIIDSTFELVWEPVLEKLMQLNRNLDNVEYYCNSRDTNYAEETIKKSQNLGLKIYQSQYFADHQHYYKPIISNTTIEKKNYVLYTGKTRPERTLLIALLSYYNLLDYGYVSYFGNDFNEYYKDGKIEQVFELHEVINDEHLKLRIEEGISKLNLPLKIDVNTLSYNTAHAKTFNADYYLASDFAIVCETDCDNNFFITEKTIKCILLDKKFLVFGSVNYVSKLKKYYLTKFHKDISHLTDWCNLSYDDEPDKCKRAELIIEEIKKKLKK